MYAHPALVGHTYPKENVSKWILSVKIMILETVLVLNVITDTKLIKEIVSLQSLKIKTAES